MRKIPLKLREEMSADPFYTECCAQGYFCVCDGVIQWHHNLIFKGNQSDEKWTILPVCEEHHKNANNKILREYLNWIMLNRATTDQLSAISKAIDYKKMRDRLNQKYGMPKKIWVV